MSTLFVRPLKHFRKRRNRPFRFTDHENLTFNYQDEMDYEWSRECDLWWQNRLNNNHYQAPWINSSRRIMILQEEYKNRQYVDNFYCKFFKNKE